MKGHERIEGLRMTSVRPGPLHAKFRNSCTVTASHSASLAPESKINSLLTLASTQNRHCADGHEQRADNMIYQGPAIHYS